MKAGKVFIIKSGMKIEKNTLFVDVFIMMPLAFL